MIISLAILILSAAMLCFYVQAMTERILHRQVLNERGQLMVKEFHLDFPAVAAESSRRSFGSDGRVGRDRLLTDYIVLDYLLANVIRHRFTLGERLLRVRFELTIAACRLRHSAASQQSCAASLARILQYFTNIAGEELPIAAPIQT